MVTIFIPEQLRKVLGGSQLELDVASIDDFIKHVAVNHPEALPRIYRDGRFNHFVNVYVNGEDIKFLDNLATKLKSGDEVSLVAAMAGG